MNPKHVIVGTAGHIDHGKSALVEALTGTNPDRLEEEKRRGITIDLGFAFLDLEDVRLGIVDVPGHERFVKNMLAGVGGIDLVMLVVAADESIKPQTREHFDICRLLAIPRGIAVITKADLVDADVLGLVRLEVEEFVRGSFLEGAPMVAVSARTGNGLDELRRVLLQVARDIPARDAGQYFRLPVDRAFAVKGFGTVATGTLISGSVRAEDEVELFPAQRRVRVRGVQSGGRATERAVAGQRTAINLAGVDRGEVVRGMSLTAPGRFEATRRIDVRLSLLPSARALKHRARVHFHHGTAEMTATVALLGRDTLAPGEAAFAQLYLSAPLLILPGDRFIFRQFSPVVTIGGGVVLDNLPPRHRRSDRQIVPLLEKLGASDRAEVLAVLTAAHPRGFDQRQMIARTGWLEATVRETTEKLAASGRVRVIQDDPLLVVSSGVWNDCLRRMCETVETFHKANPLLPGIPREELRERVASAGRRRGVLRPEFFRAALDALIAGKELGVAGDVVQRAGREISLRPEEEKAKGQIAQEFARAGLTVPPVKEVLGKLPVESKRAQKILQILLREGALVKVAEDLVFHRDAIGRLRELLANFKAQKGQQLSVPAFKDLTGVSRKYAIPLLEYLDRERVTRRVGDARVIL